MVQAAKDPMMAINQIAANNPQMQQVMQLINQNGGLQNAKQLLYNMAQQRGVDPNTILSQVPNFNQNGRKL